MSWRSISQTLARSAITTLGNDVLILGVSGRGILRSPTEEVLDGVVFVTDYLVELPVTTWPTMPEGTAIQVDGVYYIAREEGRINRDQSSLFIPLQLAPSSILGPVFAAGVYEDGVFETGL